MVVYCDENDQWTRKKKNSIARYAWVHYTVEFVRLSVVEAQTRTVSPNVVKISRIMTSSHEIISLQNSRVSRTRWQQSWMIIVEFEATCQEVDHPLEWPSAEHRPTRSELILFWEYDDSISMHPFQLVSLGQSAKFYLAFWITEDRKLFLSSVWHIRRGYFSPRRLIGSSKYRAAAE
jgi:hypothetical protein